ncbi:MAG: FAD-dependent oxidoreductase, partial [Acidimicrobiales bacterium]
MPAEALHDVVIIGAGAAGVSAAIECFDIKLDVMVLEGAGKVGGQIDEIPHTVRNVAPAPDGNDALVEALAHHASVLGDRLQLDRKVTGLDLDNGTVVAGAQPFRTRSVLMATGSRRRELENAPEGSFGGAVTYLVEPHLARFAG